MLEMTIAKLASEAEVSVETVRFYQRRGLMPEPARPTRRGGGAGFRHYGREEVRRLRFIKAAQAAGFTLHEISELLTLDATDDRARAREMARARIAVLDLKVAELRAAREALSRLARRCARGDSGPCPILSAFENS